MIAWRGLHELMLELVETLCAEPKYRVKYMKYRYDRLPSLKKINDPVMVLEGVGRAHLMVDGRDVLESKPAVVEDLRDRCSLARVQF